jgi:hypothetical protein
VNVQVKATPGWFIQRHVVSSQAVPTRLLTTPLPVATTVRGRTTTAVRQGPGIVFICGMPRAGSMWTYNVARNLLRVAGRSVKPEREPPTDDRTYLLQSLYDALVHGQPQETYVWKTHELLRRNIPGTRYITTYRDIRAATFSFMRFTRCDFERALSAARVMMATVDHYMDFPDSRCLKLDYDLIVSNPFGVAVRINTFLGCGVPDELIRGIADSFKRERVIEIIASAEDKQDTARVSASEAAAQGVFFVSNLDDTPRVGDAATGFQSGHVSGLGDDAWQHQLTEPQKGQLEAVCGNWLRRHTER